MSPSWRKPAGMIAILALIVAWCVLVASASNLLARWPWWAQAGFYLVTGIVWITPLKPVLRWMERRGRNDAA